MEEAGSTRPFTPNVGSTRGRLIRLLGLAD